MTSRVLAGMCVIAVVLSACGDGAQQGAPSPAPTAPQGIAVPPAVADKRDAIERAAREMDFEGLRGLLEEQTFSYSFGEGGDPIRYWQRQEADAHVPVIGDILPAVLAMPVGFARDFYTWPRAATVPPDQWTAEDREALKAIHSEEDIASFEAAGNYLGWRTGIHQDGTWSFFVAGD